MAAPVRIVSPEDYEIEIVKWKVKKDSMVFKGSILGLYKGPKTKPDACDKLKSSANGIVDEIHVAEGMRCCVKPGTLLMTIRQQDSGGCTHPTVMKEMCADCGADLRREPGVAGDRREKMAASVAMVHNIPELIVSQEQALELGREDEERLLKTRKLVLLVDLDQTLIHTTNDNIPPRLKDVHHFQLWQGPQSSWYHTKLRPHTLTFLQKVSKMYELHICTFGVRLYAHTVARLMDPQERFFSHRILSRDECFDPLSKTANLKALFPCGDAMVCIIDDREDVWNRAPNLIHVKPYRFFQGTADINAPPGLEKSENDNVPIHHKVIPHHNGPVTTTVDEEQGKDSVERKTSGGEGLSSVDMKTSEGEGLSSVDVKTGEGEGSSSTCSPGDDGEGQQGTAERSGQPGLARAGEEKAGESDVVQSMDAAQNDATSPSGLARKEGGEGEKNSGDTDSCAAGPQSVETTAQAASDLAEDLCVSSDSDSLSGDVSDSDSSRNVAQKEADPSGDVSTQDKTVPSDKTSSQDKTVSSDDTNSAEKAAEDEAATQGEVDRKPAEAEVKSQEEETAKGDGGSDKTAEPSSVSGCSAENEAKDTAGGDEDEVEWDDEDDYLLHLEEILTRIHQAFYAMIDERRQPSSTPASSSTTQPDIPPPGKKNSLPNLKSIIPYVRRKTLKGCSIVFSGMVPLNTPPEKSQAYMVARALGATVQHDIVGPKEAGKKGEVTTHLVAAKPGTSKHKTALRTRGVLIVSSAWLWACNERWEHCDERLFSLPSDPAPSDCSATVSKKEQRRKHKRAVSPSKEQGEGDAGRGSRGKKRRKAQAEEREGGRKGGGVGEGTSQAGGTFADTVSPLLAFSDEDLECMDKEVDELMAEDESASEETDNERDQRYRDTVLGSVSESSSSDSLSGDLPRGWGLRRKSKSSPHPSEDDLEKRKHEEIEMETEDTENEMVRFQTTVETFSPDTDSNSSYAESIGSVDDEIAEAVEKEFLGSL
ncbi:RNA polymerase II subunit A C-terminal domain phosphatase-like [Babylonia areolata]|uniref:RNA polymerase II subunit A C-terminal domain phosphatase-like n=1 Tax=Babylonia areolata TaxID=304850 RepID=UPI003FD3824D